MLKAPFCLNVFSEDLLVQRTSKVDDLLVHWSKPLVWGKWTLFLSHPAVLFYSCLEYLCVCVRSLLQSRFFCFFVCLFVSYWNFFFLLLLCFLTGLDHQGIFRLSGSTTEINDMKQLFENGNKTERSLLWEISLLLCHVHFTSKALTFTQITCICM